MRRRVSGSRARAAAQRRLKRLRQGSLLVVGLTALLLLATPEGRGQDPVEIVVPEDPAAAVEEATGTLVDLLAGAWAFLPKLVVAAGLLLLAWLLSRLVRGAVHRVLGDWRRADAVSAMSALILWLLALGTALSVLAGDARALVGSVGLVGLALSWALQAPIESFTGWLLNSFRGYYRPGDRIAVGDVFGDVVRIDFLNTVVWELGGPGKAVQGAQPTGAQVSFPNAELLRASVTNYTRDFPYVFDEVSFAIASESDLAHAIAVARGVACEVVGDRMDAPAREYVRLLKEARLDHDVPVEPQVYLSGTEFWTNLTVRYLVPARERRKWSSRLHEALTKALNAPEQADRILPAYVLEHQKVEDRRR